MDSIISEHLAHLPREGYPEFTDVVTGDAEIVRCPDCGQPEIWWYEESVGHGQCRISPVACVLCPSWRS